MTDLTSYIILEQIPVVFLLIIIGFLIYKNYGIQEFKLICLGWILNFIYLITSFLSFNFRFNLPEMLLNVAPTFTDLICSYVFFYVLKESKLISITKVIQEIPFFYKLHRFQTASINIHAITIIIFILAGLYKVYPHEGGLIPYILVRNFPVALINFLVLYLLANFFKIISEKYTTSKLLYISTYAYACIQFLSILQEDSFAQMTNVFLFINTIGFSLGLLIKVSMLVGLVILQISIGKNAMVQRALEQQENEFRFREIELNTKKKEVERFENILNTTFHELNLPVMALGLSLDELTNPQSQNPRESRLMQVVSDYEDVRAIFMVAKQTTSSKEKNNFDEKTDKENQEKIFESLNELIQNAFRLAKSGKWKMPFERKADFGGRCLIECYPHEVIQIFVNLFKNAFESYELKKESNPNVRGLMVIRTYNSKFDEEPKLIIAEIEDYALGIPEEIQGEIWKEHFTTKQKTDLKVRGIGLSAVKALIEKNDGWSIQLESPIKRGESVIGGTKFILSFPKVKQ